MLIKLFKKFKDDEKASVLPLIAVVLILIIIIGIVNFSLVVMYRDRAVVRNALDAGVTSSLALGASEEFRALNYVEALVTVKTATMHCERSVKVGEDSDGKPIYEMEPYSIQVPRVKHWVNAENTKKNYVKLTDGQGIAMAYFSKNMEENGMDYSLISFSYNVTYDDKRIYTLNKDRTIVPYRIYFEEGVPPSWCDRGTPDIYNKVTTPKAWWRTDFAGANTGDWEMAEKWEDTPSVEEREVIFPRWVEVKASVTVEMPVPLGKLMGKRSYRSSFDIVAFKELKEVID